MAIQDSFSLSNAVNSQSYAYKCWYNYNYGNNTMGISAKDMGEITQTWNSQLSNWRANALDDENAYEIEDDDFSTAKMNGKNQAKEATGYDGDKSYGSVVNAGLSIAGATTGKVVGNGLAKMGLGFKDVTGGHKAVTDTGKGKMSDIATVIMAAAVAAKYWVAKPNKDSKEACDALQDEMNNATAALGNSQNEMSDMRDEIETLSDDAQMANEDANGEIEDKKSEYDFYKASYDALMEKVNSGEQLTDDEKELLKELVPIMQQLGIDITDTQEETTDTVGEIYEEMGTYQEGYDNAAETVAEVQGLTDYAEGFDSNTQTMCYFEAGSQTVNAGSATLAATKLAGKAFVGWAFAAIGYAAAASSGIATAQQMSWAGDVGTEIGMRKDTQDLNAATNDIYAESIDVYDGQMGVVNDLEIEMPDDLADPEAVAESLNEETARVLGGDGASSDTGLGVSTRAAGATGGSKPATNTAGAQDDKDKDKKVV